MTRNLLRTPFFPLSLLCLCLLVCCALGGYVYGESAAEQRDAPNFATGRKGTLEASGNEREGEIFADAFLSPSVVKANGTIVAFFVSSLDLSRTNNGVVARQLCTEGDYWVRYITGINRRDWISQQVIQHEENLDKAYTLRTPMAVAKGNKIYLLVLTHRVTDGENGTLKYIDWEFVLAVGEVKTTCGANEAGEAIEWVTDKDRSALLTQEVKDMLLEVPFSGAARSAFLAEDGSIVFAVRATKGDKDASAIIRLKDTGSGAGWSLSYADTPEGCSSPSFFSWEGRLHMIPAQCDGDVRKVKVSSDMGVTWADDDGLFSLLWDNTLSAGDFTPATIDGKSVLLFAQETLSRYGPGKYQVNVWLFDGARIFNVARTINYYNSFPSGGKLLYADDEIFSLYNRPNGSQMGVHFVRQAHILRAVKATLRAWNLTDRYLSQPCNDTAPQYVSSSEKTCVTPMLTDGLVGYLSNFGGNYDGIWEDEYFYVDAEIVGGKKVPKGFMFDMPNGGARWPVGSQWKEKKYTFGRHGITIVAIATIHNAAEGVVSPLLTVGRFNRKPGTRQGLFYRGDKRWELVSRHSHGAGVAGYWEPNETYRVALVLQSNTSTLSAYVNGCLLAQALWKPPSAKSPYAFANIFIGGHMHYAGVDDASAGGRVTVSDAFLYDRPLSDMEIKAMDRRPDTCPESDVQNNLEKTKGPAVRDNFFLQVLSYFFS